MNNFFLQFDGDWFLDIIDKFNPIHFPQDAFVTDLAIIMILAGVVTLAFFKIRQPLIIGYLFAGMLIGPLSPLWTSFFVLDTEQITGAIGILSDVSTLNIFAEIGVILLLFVIGIEFPFAKFRSIGKIAVGVGSIGLFLTLGISFYVTSLFGLN